MSGPLAPGPTAMSVRARNQAAPVLMVIEEFQGLDEGRDKWCAEMSRALARHGVLISHTTPAQPRRRPPRRLLTRFAAVVAVARHPGVRGIQLRGVLYASVSPMTAPALIRAQLLRRLLRAPVAMVVICPNRTTGVSRLLARRLPPDLVLLGTEEECRAARDIGLRAALIWSGCDPRFRPPMRGEKAALRGRWGIPPDDFVILHVGHLWESRNLEALLPVAAVPGITTVVVASQRRAPESDQLEERLSEGGVRVVRGYLPQVEELYKLSDCYVFPSTFRSGAVSTPLSVVEARACGLPVVARSFGSLGEGVGAALDVDVVASDAELVTHLLAHASQRRAPPPLPETFTWDSVARRAVELLDRLSDDPGVREGLPGDGRARQPDLTERGS